MVPKDQGKTRRIEIIRAVNQIKSRDRSRGGEGPNIQRAKRLSRDFPEFNLRIEMYMQISLNRIGLYPRITIGGSFCIL